MLFNVGFGLRQVRQGQARAVRGGARGEEVSGVLCELRQRYRR